MSELEMEQDYSDSPEAWMWTDRYSWHKCTVHYYQNLTREISSAGVRF